VHRSRHCFFFAVQQLPWKWQGAARGRAAAGCTWCKNAVGRASRWRSCVPRSSPCANSKPRAGFLPCLFIHWSHCFWVLIRLITLVWSRRATRFRMTTAAGSPTSGVAVWRYGDRVWDRDRGGGADLSGASAPCC